MKFPQPAAVLTLALLATAGEAAAAEHGFYIGGGYSSVSADYSPSVRVTDLTAGIPDPGPDRSERARSSGIEFLACTRRLPRARLAGDRKRFQQIHRQSRDHWPGVRDDPLPRADAR